MEGDSDDITNFMLEIRPKLPEYSIRDFRIEVIGQAHKCVKVVMVAYTELGAVVQNKMKYFMLQRSRMLEGPDKNKYDDQDYIILRKAKDLIGTIIEQDLRKGDKV